MSEEKRKRQTLKKQARRQQLKSRLKTMIRNFRTKAGENQGTIGDLRRVASEIDKACKNGIIHKNAASRKKSRMAKLMASTAANKSA